MNTYRKRFLYTLAVTVIVVFTSTYAILMTLERTDYRNYLQAQYSKNLYELIDDIENIQDSLGKTAITSNEEQNVLIFEDIYRYSSAANNALNSLPIAPNISANTGKFINQVGDYCYSLIKNSSDGKELSDSDYKTLDKLEEESNKLKMSLNNVLSDINRGDVKWGEIREKINGIIGGKKNEISTKFTDIEKQVVQYPALIYDGPFSDNTLEIEPKINRLRSITAAEAKKTAAEVVGKQHISKIDLVQAKGKMRIEAYGFNIYVNSGKKKNIISCEISKHGGKLISLLNDRGLSEPRLNEKQAEQKGLSFLEKLGYKDMKSSYTLRYEDNMVINYVHRIGKISIYPEQIQLKVAMDDGNIVGFQAEKYLTAYNPERKLIEPKISMQAAKKSLSRRLKILKTGLAVIPTETNKEIFCYEFYGKHRGNEFIIYVNASTGRTERILKIVNTSNGKLMI